MADTTGNTFVSPVMVDGKLQTIIHALGKFLKTKFDDITSPPRAKVVLTAAQLVGTGVVSMIVWPNPTTSPPYSYQYGGTFWSAAAPSRFTAPVAGWYRVDFAQQLDVNATGARFMGIMVNGTTWITQQTGAGNAVFYWGGSVGTDIYLNAGDYVEAGVYHTAGIAINVMVTYTVGFSIRRIAKP